MILYLVNVADTIFYAFFFIVRDFFIATYVS